MLIKKPDDIKSSEITPQSIYEGRREFLKGAGIVAGASLLPGNSTAQVGAGLKAPAPAGLQASPAAPCLRLCHPRRMPSHFLRKRRSRLMAT
jgi:hypothetical protein